jgi:hypothetical protein
MTNYQSPTGSPILGTLETTACRCNINGIADDGTPDYSGESDMFWDDTEPLTRDGKILFLDADGESWTFDQLTKIEEAVAA